MGVKTLFCTISAFPRCITIKHNDCPGGVLNNVGLSRDRRDKV